jgi:hypothetical protein
VVDGRNLGEAWRAIDELRAERREYVRRDVYLADQRADRASIKRLEDDDTSKASGTRTWLLGLVQMVLAVVLGAAAAYLTARGAH